jgi:hypothetical protein
MFRPYYLRAFISFINTLYYYYHRHCSDYTQIRGVMSSFEVMAGYNFNWSLNGGRRNPQVTDTSHNQNEEAQKENFIEFSFHQ